MLKPWYYYALVDGRGFISDRLDVFPKQNWSDFTGGEHVIGSVHLEEGKMIKRIWLPEIAWKEAM